MNTQVIAAAARLVESRAAQGLPPKITDAAALRRIAEIIRPNGVRRDHLKAA
jgi:hypothetical protein